MSEAEKLLKHMSEFAEYAFKENGEIHPMWILVGPEGPVPLVTPFHGGMSKDVAVAMARAAAKQLKATSAGFMAEAWAVEGSEEQLGDVRKISPSKHEDRREVIHIFAEDEAGNAVSGQYYILRPEHGAAKLSPFKQNSPGGEMGGRFTSILDRSNEVRH